MRKVFIYILSDPDTLEVKYIGKTYRPQRRFNDHLKCNRNTKKDTWIKSILKNNKTPIFDIIDETNEVECDFWEQHWISLFKSWGFDLKNMTNGGDGSYGLIPWNKGLKGIFKHTVESREAMSKYRKGLYAGSNNPMFGKKRTKESIEEQIKRQLNSKRTEEQKQKISGALSANAKSIFCFDINDNFIKKYDCILDVKKDNFDPSMVCKVCKNKRKSHKNHKFSYNNKVN